MVKSHKNLKVWQEAMNLASLVYEMSKTFPEDERYGLVSQMRRAAVSIPSNIAEGSARATKKDTIHFYVVARASLSELDTQLELCKMMQFVGESSFSALSQKLDVVDSLLSGLIRFHKKM
jgi:four helix bundle protein